MTCQQCNVLLGQAKDNPDTLRAAIAYLTTPLADRHVLRGGLPSKRAIRLRKNPPTKEEIEAAFAAAGNWAAASRLLGFKHDSTLVYHRRRLGMPPNTAAC